jgi:Concanavalin A-like lectin/glucanases superfamily/Secretion system C-terminal sorting domain
MYTPTRFFLLLFYNVLFLPLANSQIWNDPALSCYYKFENNANDLSGKGNNGTLNGVSFVKDKNGQNAGSLSFVGDVNWVNYGDKPSLRFAHNESFSVSMSVYVDAQYVSNYSDLLRYDDRDDTDGDSPLERDLMFIRTNNLLEGFILEFVTGHQFEFSTDFNIVKSELLPYNKWVSITCIYDANKKVSQIYINGCLVNEIVNTSSYPWKTTGQYLMSGFFNSDVSSFSFKGLIDDLIVTKRAFNESDIRAAMKDMGFNFSIFESARTSALYDFNDNLKDFTQNGFNAVSALTTYSSGRLPGNKAVVFNGNNSWLRYPNNPQLQFFSDESFSLSVTANVSPNPNNPYGDLLRYDDQDDSDGDTPLDRSMMLLRTINSIDGYRLEFQFGSWLFTLPDITSLVSKDLSYNKWYNFTIVYNAMAKTTSLYIDGCLEIETINTNVNEWATLGQYLMSGKFRSQFSNIFFKGAIDEIAIFKQALCPKDIASMLTGFKIENPCIAVLDVKKQASELPVAKIYPNPVNDMLIVDLGGSDEPNVEYEVFDLSGRLMMKGRVETSIQQISLQTLYQGTYILQLSSKNSSIYQPLRFIKSN